MKEGIIKSNVKKNEGETRKAPAPPPPRAKKEEELYFPGLDFPRKFDVKRPGMKLLINTRNEAHRFALRYHRLLRGKEALA